LKELEQKFPNFEMCHLCLGHGLAWTGDIPGAQAEYRKAAELDPTDPEAHTGLGNILEKQKDYEGALAEFRLAEKLGPDVAHTHEDAGRVLLAQKKFASAAAELKNAENLSPSSSSIHDLYGQILEAQGQSDLAIAEFKEAVEIDPTQGLVKVKLGKALEKKGDWVAALEQYRKASLTDASIGMKAQPGQSFMACGKECSQQYTAAQGRFADYLVSLKAAGRGAEAEELKKRVAMLDSSSGTAEKVQMAMKAGDQAFQERKIEDAEKDYKEAVDLAQTLPPGDENLTAALGRLGNAYGMQQKFTEASATFHQELAVVEKTFGPGSERSVQPLQFLGQLAAWQKNYPEAEGYLQRALDINVKMSGDNNPRAVESLRAMAGLYMAESDWPKAETYLLRAVKGAEATDTMVLIPLWGLCDMYDRWGKPDKSQPCWHQATELMAKQAGENSPQLAQSLTNEATALRKLGRGAEAQQLEERVAKIHRTGTN
jgi:tetratricopeptide (TPR) repeat protein